MEPDERVAGDRLGGISGGNQAAGRAVEPGDGGKASVPGTGAHGGCDQESVNAALE